METLKDKTPQEILNIIKVIVLTFDNIEDIDENYGLDFIIIEYGKQLLIKYTWALGAYKNIEPNPIYRVEKLLMNEDNFFINKNSPIKDLVKEVREAINKVLLNAFDPEIED
jgi:hypothetical protein